MNEWGGRLSSGGNVKSLTRPNSMMTGKAAQLLIKSKSLKLSTT